MQNTNELKLPSLPYDYDMLEPYYDKETLQIHHQKHHATYVKGLNNALSKLEEARESNDFSLIKHWEKEIAFHGAGHKLHSLFWQNMRPAKENNKAEPELLKAIETSFGSWEKFIAQFKAATIAIEGSGWGILAMNEQKNLQIFTIENHQKCFIPGLKPLLVCDVWEHAYYLKYQNKRGEYLDNFLKLINWQEVEMRYKK